MTVQELLDYMRKWNVDREADNLRRVARKFTVAAAVLRASHIEVGAQDAKRIAHDLQDIVEKMNELQRYLERKAK